MNKTLKKTQSNKNKKYFLHFFEPQIGIEEYEFFNIEKLKKIKKQSIGEFYISDVLDYILENDKINVFRSIVDKIEDGGKCYIQGTDARLLSEAFIYNQINIQTYKNILYYNSKCNIHTLGQLKDFISIFPDIKIDKIKFINGIQYFIECSK